MCLAVPLQIISINDDMAKAGFSFTAGGNGGRLGIGSCGICHSPHRGNGRRRNSKPVKRVRRGK